MLARRRPEIDAILAAYGVPRADAADARRGRPMKRARSSSSLARAGARRLRARGARASAPTRRGRERARRSRWCRCRRARPARRARSAARARSSRTTPTTSRQGKRLYRWFNCIGCHANGGGGIGPALMDDRWIYGSAIENIVADDPRGPAERHAVVPRQDPGRPDLAARAYVRSMSGNVPKDAAPGRDDDMQPRPAENRTPDLPARDRRQRAALGARRRNEAAMSAPRFLLSVRRPRPRGLPGLAVGARSAGPQAQRARLACSGCSPPCCAAIWVARDDRARRRARCARGRAATPTRSRLDPAAERRIDRRRRAAVAVATGVTVLVADRAQLSSRSATLCPRRGRTALTIHVTGHQWWWEVRYEDADAEPQLHDRQRAPHPGRRAGAGQARVRRRDPQLLGAEPHGQAGPDPGPARTTSSFSADRPGVYRGQCAEFCGLQHAHGLARRRRAARRRSSAGATRRSRPRRAAGRPERQQRARRSSSSQPCVMCHTIRGTPARRRGSRPT